MAVRSAPTERRVRAGALAGVTGTVRSVLAAGSTADGDATPKPDGCVGSPPQKFGGAALFRGIGPTLTKSFALLSVSTHPLARRTEAVVLLSPAAGAVSEQLAAP